MDDVGSYARSCYCYPFSVENQAHFLVQRTRKCVSATLKCEAIDESLLFVLLHWNCFDEREKGIAFQFFYCIIYLREGKKENQTRRSDRIVLQDCIFKTVLREYDHDVHKEVSNELFLSFLLTFLLRLQHSSVITITVSIPVSCHCFKTIKIGCLVSLFISSVNINRITSDKKWVMRETECFFL